MAEYLHTDVNLLADTNKSVLEHGGKFMRPMVSLLTAQAAGGINEDSLRLAAATEILHNATLMHDDVTDGSKERRGVPTLMSVLGPSAAVLVGDFWLAKAVEVVFDTSCQDKVKRLYSRTMSDLSEGEMLQLEKSISADTDREAYLRIIYCKTASLFRTACMSAAISVSAADRLLEAASGYGTALGMAFQIKDDILDYAGTPELGKPVGVDIREGKITLPLLGAIRNLPERETEIREIVRNAGKDGSACSEVRDIVLNNGGMEYASAVLDTYIEQAVTATEAYGASPFRDALREMARYNACRQV